MTDNYDVLDTLAIEANEVSTKSGFDKNYARFAADPELLGMWHSQKLMLMVTELGETLEELRDGHDASEIYWSVAKDATAKAQAHEAVQALEAWLNGDASPEDQELLIQIGALKPEGAVVELADLIIRALQWAGRSKLPIGEAVRIKTYYNGTRELMHGRKY